MQSKTTTILSFFAASLFLFAQSTFAAKIKDDAPNVYVVKKGDTLWDISSKYLEDPWRWPELWSYNQHIEDAHWIYPGDRLTLVEIDGVSKIVINQESLSFSHGSEEPSPKITETSIDKKGSDQKTITKDKELSGKSKQENLSNNDDFNTLKKDQKITEEEIVSKESDHQEDAQNIDTSKSVSLSGDNDGEIYLTPETKYRNNNIDTLQMSDIESALLGIMDYDFSEFNYSYILSGDSSEIVNGVGDHVYIKNNSNYQIGERLMILRRPVEVGDGVFMEKKGEVVLEKKIGSSYLARVTESRFELFKGDLLTRYRSVKRNFNISSKYEVDFDKAEIIVPFRDYIVGSQNDAFFIEKGTENGVEQGQVYSIHENDISVRDPYSSRKIYVERAPSGYAVVVKVFEEHALLKVASGGARIREGFTHVKKLEEIYE